MNRIALISLFSFILLILMPNVPSYHIIENISCNCKNDLNNFENVTYYNYTWNLSGFSRFEFKFNFPENWKQVSGTTNLSEKFTGYYTLYHYDGGYFLRLYYTGLFLLGYKITHHISWLNNDVGFYGKYYHIYKGFGYGSVKISIKLVTD